MSNPAGISLFRPGALDAMSGKALTWCDVCPCVCANGCCETAELQVPDHRPDASLFAQVRAYDARRRHLGVGLKET